MYHILCVSVYMFICVSKFGDSARAQDGSKTTAAIFGGVSNFETYEICMINKL